MQGGLLACVYRLAQDGLPSLLPYVTRQVIRPTLSEMLAVLQVGVGGGAGQGGVGWGGAGDERLHGGSSSAWPAMP